MYPYYMYELMFTLTGGAAAIARAARAPGAAAVQQQADINQ